MQSGKFEIYSEAYTRLRDFVLEKLEVPDWPHQPNAEAAADGSASIAARLLVSTAAEAYSVVGEIVSGLNLKCDSYNKYGDLTVSISF